MDKTKSVKNIPIQKSPTSASVKEKLFFESIETNITSPAKPEQKILTSPCETLIQESVSTGNNMQQIKKNKEILEKARSVPVMIGPGTSSKPKIDSKYIDSVVFSSQLYKLKKIYTRGSVYSAKICLDHLDLRPSHCKSSLAYKILRSDCSSENLCKKMLNLYYSKDKNKRLLGSKKKDRKSSDFRSQKGLNDDKKNNGDKKNKSCKIPIDIRKASSVEKFETLGSFGDKSSVVSLSPHKKKVAFRAGSNLKEFLAMAVPMAQYKAPTPFYYWNRVIREHLSRN